MWRAVSGEGTEALMRPGCEAGRCGQLDLQEHMVWEPRRKPRPLTS